MLFTVTILLILLLFLFLCVSSASDRFTCLLFFLVLMLIFLLLLFFFCLSSGRSTCLLFFFCSHVNLSAPHLFAAYTLIDLQYIPARCSFLLPCWSFCSSCFSFCLSSSHLLACCSFLFSCWSLCSSCFFFCLSSDRSICTAVLSCSNVVFSLLLAFLLILWSIYFPVVLTCFHVDLSFSFGLSAYPLIDLLVCWFFLHSCWSSATFFCLSSYRSTCLLFFLVFMLISLLLLFFFMLIHWSIYWPDVLSCSHVDPLIDLLAW